MSEVLDDDEFELDGKTYRIDFSGEAIAQAEATMAQFGFKGLDVRGAFASRAYLPVLICVAASVSTERRRVTWRKLSKSIEKCGRRRYAEIEAKASKAAVRTFQELGLLEEDDDQGEEQAEAPQATRASASSGSPAATTSPSEPSSG